MKKTTKTLLSLLLVLVMALQFGAVAPIAHAELNTNATVTLDLLGPVEEGKLSASGSLGAVTDAEDLKAFSVPATVGALRSDGLTLTPPEGFAVTSLYLAPAAGAYESVLLASAALTEGEDDGCAITIPADAFAGDSVFNGTADAYILRVQLRADAVYVPAKASTCTVQGNDPYCTVGGDPYEIGGLTAIPTRPVDPDAHNATLTHYEAVIADCTTAGHGEYWECPDCHQLFSAADGSTKIDEIPGQVPALNHDWGAVTYTWTDDHSQCTAERVCSRDPSHKETETVAAGVVTTATCEAAGRTTYTATFTTNPAFMQQTAEVDVAALGHKWTITYTWADDFSKCTASAVCANGDHPVSEEVVPTSSTTKEATCTEKGEITYTAAFTKAPFETQTKPKEVDALGHIWGEPTYAWSKDFSECTAERVCAHGDKETETVKSVPTFTATCTEAGTVSYTATFENAAFAAQTTPAVTQAALGHDWGEITYTWADDNSTVTAERICSRDASHKETETVKATGAVTKAATAEADGERTFTSEAFKNEAFAVQTKKVAIPKAGTPAVITEGTESKWSPDDKDGLSIHLDATFNEENVKGIVVKADGTAIDAKYIKITPGSVVVTIDPSYLSTLTPGTHTITVSFPSGHDVPVTVTIDTSSSLSFAIDEAGFTKVYDGTSFDLNSLKSYITVVNLPTGHTAEIEISFEDSSVTEIHNAGSTTVKLHLKSVKDGSGADVTSSFTCADKTGVPLTITKRKITVETRDDSKVYDGKAWTYAHMSNPQPIMTYTDPKLGEYARGGNTYVQTISIKYTASPKNMGTYDNKADLIIREKVKGSSEAGTDVTSNYEITYKYGKIKITDSKGNVPKSSYATGDNNNIWLWVGLMAAAVILVVVILVFTRKGKKRGDVTNP